MEPAVVYIRALGLARRFLAHCPDLFTHSSSDELSQEVAVQTWRRCRTGDTPRKLSSYVYTVARRVRARAIQRRTEGVRYLGDADTVCDVAATDESADRLFVDGCWLERDEVLAALADECAALSVLNARLVRGFYEGFSCQELAMQCELDQAAIKVRLYRCRHRIRRGLLRRLGRKTG